MAKLSTLYPLIANRLSTGARWKAKHNRAKKNELSHLSTPLWLLLFIYKLTIQ